MRLAQAPRKVTSAIAQGLDVLGRAEELHAYVLPSGTCFRRDTCDHQHVCDLLCRRSWSLAKSCGCLPTHCVRGPMWQGRSDNIQQQLASCRHDAS